MKKKELVKKSVDELKTILNQTLEENAKVVLEKLDDTSKNTNIISNNKKKVARIKTLINEHVLGMR